MAKGKAAGDGGIVAIGDSAFYNMDCIEGARKHIPDGSVDLIVTDPPYGIGGDRLHKHYNRREDFVVDGYVEVPSSEYAEFSRRWIREAERILKPSGQIYIVSGYTHLYEILAALRGTSLEEVNHIVWKYNFGVFTRKKYISSHYHILYYAKPGGKGRRFNTSARFGLLEKDGASSLNYRDREDVWIINREYKPGKVKNKNELPRELLKKIVQYSSDEDDVVCDLFLGGFSTAEVAIGLNRRFVGFEISPKIFAAKVPAMRALKPGSLLPTLRKPSTEAHRNQGRGWTEAERAELRRRYAILTSRGKKGESIRALCDEFGRGRWAVEKALKK